MVREETPTGRPLLEARGLAKVFEGRHRVEVFQDLTFRVDRGEFVCVVGPSGCGKTTLLRVLAGLTPPTRGRALLDGQPIASTPREMVLVFQDYTKSLLPWRLVQGNVAFAIERDRALSRDERRARVAKYLDLVGLGRMAEFYPWQLSGGMQQRVAIARALAREPKLLLMDEPFASVDAQTRAILEDLLLGLHGSFIETILFVTHDIDEAIYLSDRVVVLSRRPTRVIQDVAVDLPRPRHQLQTRGDPAFAKYRERIALAIQSLGIGEEFTTW
ncbi:MAG: ABC transporter ATP-binding protein [Actinobacteria bacterium]|nr:ABC transporter ATP-binding protein [Actinomycetota bacterium]